MLVAAAEQVVAVMEVVGQPALLYGHQEAKPEMPWVQLYGLVAALAADSEDGLRFVVTAAAALLATESYGPAASAPGTLVAVATFELHRALEFFSQQQAKLDAQHLAPRSFWQGRPSRYPLELSRRQLESETQDTLACSTNLRHRFP